MVHSDSLAGSFPQPRSVELINYSASFVSPFVFAGGEIKQRNGVYLRIRTADGVEGLGESAPLAPFSSECLADLQRAARTLIPLLQETPPPASFAEIQSSLDEIPALSEFPTLRFGVESAWCDLAAKQASLSVARFITPAASEKVPVNGVLTGDIPKFLEQLAAGLNRGVTTFKLKVGSADYRHDAARLQAIRDRAPSISLRLDANQAFNSLDTAIRHLEPLAKFKIDYVEDPLASPNEGELKDFSAITGIPVAIDIPLRDPAAAAQAITRGEVAVLVIKPSLIGGIGRTLDLAKAAQASGIKCVVTSLLESSIGLAACLHTAAALGDMVSPCGLLTEGLFSQQRSTLEVEGGCLKLPQSFGLGVDLISVG